MQVIQNPNTVTGQSSMTMATTSEYIKLFSIPAHSSANFNISSRCTNYNFGINGTLAAENEGACITATVSQEQSADNGIYALRADQPTPGGPVTLYLVYGTNPNGFAEFQITVTYAAVHDVPIIFDVVAGAAPASVKADLQVRNAPSWNSWGTTGSTY